MKTNKKSIIEVNYNDLDKAVTKFLTSKGIDCGEYGYECVAEQEWGNDQSHSFSVGKCDLDEYDKKRIKNGEIPYLGAILEWMCFEGVIEEGEYLVDVCW